MRLEIGKGLRIFLSRAADQELPTRKVLCVSLSLCSLCLGELCVDHGACALRIHRRMPASSLGVPRKIKSETHAPITPPASGPIQ